MTQIDTYTNSDAYRHKQIGENEDDIVCPDVYRRIQAQKWEPLIQQQATHTHTDYAYTERSIPTQADL